MVTPRLWEAPSLRSMIVDPLLVRSLYKHGVGSAYAPEGRLAPMSRGISG